MSESNPGDRPASRRPNAPARGVPPPAPGDAAQAPSPEMGEGLFASSTLRLFGRPYTGLALGDLGLSRTSNNPLITTLRGMLPGNQAEDRAPYGLARIYAFAYLGNYYKLPEPLIFIVFGPGAPVKSGGESASSVGQIGSEQVPFTFEQDVHVWTADEFDITVRIDVRVGWFKDLLLTDGVTSDNNLTGNADMRRPEAVPGAETVARGVNLVARGVNIIGR